MNLLLRISILLLLALASTSLIAQANSATLRAQVIGGASDRPLEGAQVTLTGDGGVFSVRTNELGQFRIPAVPAGEYQLRVTAPNYGPVESSVSMEGNDTTLPDIVLSQPSADLDRLVVTGTRSAVATALDKELLADNVASVISSDQAGKFPSDSAAEALRRAPGISFQRQERSGEGEFVSIRGLDAGLNNVKINGVNSGQADADNRRVPFSVFQGDAISEIVINKTLLPNHDGEGIGGSVEIRTATPLAQDNFLRLAIEGRDNDFADKLGYRYGVTGSRKFADDTFGVLASVSTRKRFRKVYQFDVLGDWLPTSLPLDANGDPISRFSRLPDDQAFSEDDSFEIEDMRTNIFEDERDNLSATFALGWQPSDSTNLSLSYTHSEEKITNLRNTVSFNQSDRYDDEDDLTGDLISPDGRFFYYGRSPEILVRAETEDEDTSNTSLSFRGETTRDRWSFDYGIGYAEADTVVPLSKELNFVIEDLDDLGYVPANVGPTNRSYIDFDITTNPDVPIPLLTPAGYQAITDPTQAVFDDADIDTRRETDERISANFNARYEFDRDHLRSISFGIKHETSERRDVDIELWDDDGVGSDGTVGGDDDFTLADTNLPDGGILGFGDVNNPIPGLPGILGFDRNAINRFGENLVSGVDISQVDPGDIEIEEAEEDITGLYFMANMEWGDWTVIAGARVEQQDLTLDVANSTELDFIDDSRDVDVVGARQIRTSSETVFLPRLQVNYRPSVQSVYRGALYTAVARPQFSALGGATEIEFDEEAGELNIEQGNPDLAASYSTALELSYAYYPSRASVISANVFYKRIQDFAYNNEFSDFGRDGSTFDITSIPGLEGVDPNGLDISISSPSNGNTATVTGVELAFVRQFTNWPRFWSGFGVYSNVTFQSTDIDLDIAPGFTRSVPFFNAPDYVGTVAITYEYAGIDATLGYSFQDAQIDSIEFYQIDEWEQPYESLDLSFKYALPIGRTWLASDPVIYVQVADLTDSGSNRPINHETRGLDGRRLDDLEYDGRTIRFGITANF